MIRTLVRLLLGAGFLVAGAGHLSFARRAFRAQVPRWVPADPDLVVVASGGVELALGTALVAAPRPARPWAGAAVAAFLVAVFPGNFEQWAARRDAFGLDTDRRRLVRLAFQPVLIAGVLWATRVPGRPPGPNGSRV